MVKLTEVEDEHFQEDQQDPVNDDDDFVDTDSEISDSDSDDDESIEETLYERLVALKDMIPPKQRSRISSVYNGTYSWLSSGLRIGGSALWVISASAIMLGVPYALAIGEEAQMVEMEKEMKAQQLASSSLSPSAQAATDQNTAQK